MAEKLKVGDQVQLLSDGPVMTVVSVGGGLHGDNVYVKWFAGKKTEGDSFPMAALKLATPIKAHEK